ncbi:hypothetical protein ACMZOO_03825 [Catenovulum sp. SX2]|uniref:hypothetical protein n=1 Tax=Catenovulum sp. SX2 TaxID=3398614 RepID=UPI003F87A2C9
MRLKNFKLLLCWSCLGLITLTTKLVAQPIELTVGFYFPPYQFSKAQFQYTQTLLAPEIELVPFYASPDSQHSMLVTGYDNAYHLVTHVENAHLLQAVVLGVNQKQGEKLELLRCQTKQSCQAWVYINETASYQRLRLLAQTAFADYKLVTATNNKKLISHLAHEWPELHVVSNEGKNTKTFELVKKASVLGDVYVLLPDDELDDAATGRVTLQYLFQQKVITMGFSSGSYNAGAMIASYADYPNMLLTAKLKLLSPTTTEQTVFLSACYQDYYMNEPLMSRIYGEQLNNVVNSDTLYLLADELNYQCFKKHKENTD